MAQETLAWVITVVSTHFWLQARRHHGGGGVTQSGLSGGRTLASTPKAWWMAKCSGHCLS